MPPLLTATEIAMQKSARAAHIIPAMTDPMGKHWDQPKREFIDIDDTHALMCQKTFDELSDYTMSQPSGVYPGKMWKTMGCRSDVTCYQCGAKASTGLIWVGWVPNTRYIEVLCKSCQCHWCENAAWYLRWFGEEFVHPQDGMCVSNHKREIIVL